MKVNANPRSYKWILLCSSTALLLLLCFLIYNTYQLKNESLHQQQNTSIEATYGQFVRDDKIFPGGNQVFQQALQDQIPLFWKVIGQKEEQKAKNELYLSLLHRLQKQQHFDSLFNQIKSELQITDSLAYLIRLDQVDIASPTGQNWINLLHPESEQDRRIAGSLKSPSSANRVLYLSVKEDQGISYRFAYSFFVDSPNRFMQVLESMALVLLISLICISITFILNYLTFSHWIAHRKDAQLKADFLQHIQHEFNTPIAAIMVAADMLGKQENTLKSNPTITLSSQIIQRQAKRLGRYVQQILASISLEEQELIREELEMNQLTANILMDIELKFEHQISIIYQPFSHDIVQEVDPNLYFSILDNLVSNAYKFNEQEKKEIQVTWTSASKHGMILQISDNGIGISAEESTKIFEKFYRSKAQKTKEGLGLGLFYVKTSLDRLGWTISMKPNDQLGTSFYIRIPAKP